MAASSFTNIKNDEFDNNSAQVQPSVVSINTNRVCICLLCGLPGSGKTSLLKSLTDRKDDNSDIREHLKKFIIVVIDYDAIFPDNLFSIDGDNENLVPEMNGKWKLNRNQIVLSVEAILQHVLIRNRVEFLLKSKPPDVRTEVWHKFNSILELLNSKMDKYKNKVLLIVDDNMYFRSMRYEYYKLARKYQSGFCQVHVQCTLGKAIERNKCREEVRQVSEEIILRMATKFETPNPEVYHWETNSVTANSEMDINIDQIIDLIERAIENPVQPLSEADEGGKIKCRIECSANLLHQADLIMRKCVTVQMAEMKTDKTPESLKDLSKKMFQAKKKILCDLKDSRLSIILSNKLNITDSAHSPDNEFFILIKDYFLKELFKC